MRPFAYPILITAWVNRLSFQSFVALLDSLFAFAMARVTVVVLRIASRPAGRRANVCITSATSSAASDCANVTLVRGVAVFTSLLDSWWCLQCAIDQVSVHENQIYRVYVHLTCLSLVSLSVPTKCYRHCHLLSLPEYGTADNAGRIHPTI